MSHRPSYRSWVALLVPCLALAGCQPPPPPVAQTPPPLVSVSQPVVEEVTDYDTYEGRIEAKPKVEVRARVRGHLIQVAFLAGQMVQEGMVLYEIDPRTYQTSVDAAVAQDKAAQASLEYAQSEYNRYRMLFTRGAASREEVEVWKAKEAVAKGEVLKAKAALEEAQLNLAFTKITAPISGKISRTQVDVGNLVNAGGGDTLLTTITAVDPIYVTFYVDERSLLRYRQSRPNRAPLEHQATATMNTWALALRSGCLQGSITGPAPYLLGVAESVLIATHQPETFLKELHIPVEVGLDGETGYPHKGELDFADNHVNPSTGTIEVRGVLSNAHRLFDDGMRARVRVPVTDPYKPLLITERAVGSEQGRKFVFVVNDQDVPQRRDVTPGRLTDNGLLIITEGLTKDDRVVVNGIQRVRDGLKVQPQPIPMPGAKAPAEAALPTTKK